MPRPRRCRRVAGPPNCRLFKPAAISAAGCDEVLLTEDELESIRLADLEGLYQEVAAGRMSISRQTFGRVVADARRKVALALVGGRALRIEGGAIKMTDTRAFTCNKCKHAWQVPHGTGRPPACPECGCRNFHRAVEERGQRRCSGQVSGSGRGRCPRRGGGRGSGGREQDHSGHRCEAGRESPE